MKASGLVLRRLSDAESESCIEVPVDGLISLVEGGASVSFV